MRHGNYIGILKLWFIGFDSDPTYEAWKQKIINEMEAEKWRDSDPTYEAWKQLFK